MSKINHKRSEHVDRAHSKVEWLRRRGRSDPDVVETLEVLAETMERITNRLRGLESKLDELSRNLEEESK
jgi:hypothetical protein